MISSSASSDPWIQASYLEADTFGLLSSVLYTPELSVASSPIQVDPYEAVLVWASAELWLTVNAGPGFCVGGLSGKRARTALVPRTGNWRGSHRVNHDSGLPMMVCGCRSHAARATALDLTSRPRERLLRVGLGKGTDMGR